MPLVLVPRDQLSPDALRGLIDAFVLREGTDYGHDDVSLEDKRADVMRQIERDEVVITFDPETESVNLVARADLRDKERPSW